MLFTNRKRVSQKGFTFTEILIVLAIIAGVTVLVLSQAGTVIESGTVDRAASDVRSLVAASHRYRAINPGYNNISMEQLAIRNLLPEHLVDADDDANSGDNVNPWGGNYYVSGSSGTPANIRVIVGLTNVPTDLANSLTEIIGTGTACSTAADTPGPVSTSCPSDGPTGGTAAAAVGTSYAPLPMGWTDMAGVVGWAHSFR